MSSHREFFDTLLESKVTVVEIMSRLQTARLILRGWQATDADALFDFCSDERVMKFVGNGRIWTLECCQNFIQRNQTLFFEQGYCQWAVITRETSRLIGFCGFVPFTGSGAAEQARVSETVPGGVTELEIGWRLAFQAQKHGFAREAAQAAIQWAREAGVHGVHAAVQARNTPSIRLAERIGMRLRGSRLCHDRELRRYWLDLSDSA